MTPDVLIDTDVILDVFLDRPPHNDPSKKVFAMLAQNRFRGHITATIVVNVYYHVDKYLNAATATECVRNLLRSKEIEIHPVDRAALTNALNAGMTDFEDAVQAGTAVVVGADWIVTRNKKDFVNSPVSALSPEQLLKKLA